MMSATTYTHPTLPLARGSVRRPMVDRAGARAVLDVEDWQLDGALDTGLIVGVLNIASARAMTRELRFTVSKLEEYQQKNVTTPDHAELAALIFGREQPLVRARWVYSRLNCHATHFYDLVAEKVLKLAPGSAQRPGPGGSAVVEWAELVGFIKRRRIT